MNFFLYTNELLCLKKNKKIIIPITENFSTIKRKYFMI